LSPVTPGLALALLGLAVVYGITSLILLRHSVSEGNGKEVVAMTAKQKFRAGASATASVIGGVLTNVAATAVPG
jgi:hypothetical protein